jgi:hypothetical protein
MIFARSRAAHRPNIAYGRPQIERPQAVFTTVTHTYTKA